MNKRYTTEKRFAFREELCTSNKPIPYTRRPLFDTEISLLGGAVFSGEHTPVIDHAENDLLDFLQVCFGIGGPWEKPVRIRVVLTSSDLEDVCAYKGRIVDVREREIVIRAYDDRGAAQAIYDLEDIMLTAKQPYLPRGISKNKPLFSPRMVHSAYGMDLWPEGYLQRLAKEGIDAIMLTVNGVDEVMTGHRDINSIVELAGTYGIDVYAYWNRSVYHSPEAPDAEIVYSNAYGKLFHAHPKLRGIILVGECVQFPSKDPRTSGRPYWEVLDEDGLPDLRPGPSHWPCNDYPIWLELMKKVIRRAKPDADIVFWTYNWGGAPEKERLELIRNLPTDISLMVTFEMFENLPTAYGITERVCDYSVAFAGPGRYFLSEAEEAKRRGIRLYTQANAGGRTWDFGCMRYEPFPQQWMDRYKAMRICHEKYGLTGVMECHQYGFWPSMITAMEKRAFEYICQEPDEILRSVIDTFSGGQTEECVRALDYWSQAIRLYMPTDHEQYCVMRIGPAYPLALTYFPRPPVALLEGTAVIPNCFTAAYGETSMLLFAEGKFTLHSIRVRTEIRILRDIIEYLKKGLAVFRALPAKTEEIKRLMNMGEYMICCFVTDIHVKQMFLLRTRLSIAPTRKEVMRILSGIRKVGEAEIRNAEKALICVDRDSALGWEPMMGYAGDRAHIEWKIRQVNAMMTSELKAYEDGLRF